MSEDNTITETRAKCPTGSRCHILSLWKEAKTEIYTGLGRMRPAVATILPVTSDSYVVEPK